MSNTEANSPQKQEINFQEDSKVNIKSAEKGSEKFETLDTQNSLENDDSAETNIK